MLIDWYTGVIKEFQLFGIFANEQGIIYLSKLPCPESAEISPKSLAVGRAEFPYVVAFSDAHHWNEREVNLGMYLAWPMYFGNRVDSCISCGASLIELPAHFRERGADFCGKCYKDRFRKDFKVARNWTPVFPLKDNGHLKRSQIDFSEIYWAYKRNLESKGVSNYGR